MRVLSFVAPAGPVLYVALLTSAHAGALISMAEGAGDGAGGGGDGGGGGGTHSAAARRRRRSLSSIFREIS